MRKRTSSGIASIIAFLALLLSATWCFAGFSDFDFSFDLSPRISAEVGPPDLFYLLLAGTTDNLTTPDGDKITSPQ
jgi:hypothetical protein